MPISIDYDAKRDRFFCHLSTIEFTATTPQGLTALAQRYAMPGEEFKFVLTDDAFDRLEELAEVKG